MTGNKKWVASQVEVTELGPIDLFIASVFVLALIGESIADNQQWRFHQLEQSKQTTSQFLTGAVILTALFQGSSRFTESLTLERYPAYAEYQKTTPRQFPMPRLRAMVRPSDERPRES